MKFFFVFAMFFTLSSCVLAQGVDLKQPNNQYRSIDSVLNQVLKDQYVAGFSVAVVKGGEIVYSKGFGYRDLAQKKPVTPNTLFAIGSSTKAFTASLLGLLRKDGKLSLDDKALKHLPSLKFYNEEMDRQITIRDLMSHRTGLSRFDYSWLLFNTSNRDSLISRVRYMEPTAPVRQKWYYNNFMFLAQGMIVEKITSKTWEQNIKERFFDALDMKRSNTSMKTFQADSNSSLPYATAENSTIKKIDYYDINGMGPAGSINSSANDMANWLKVWVNGGKYNGKEILPANYVSEAAGSQMVMSEGLPGQHDDVYFSNYGLGWMLSSYRGHYMVQHGGNINGFSASVAFFPTDEIGIVVLANQNVSAVPGVVRNSIVDRLLGLKPIDWNGDAKRSTAAANLAAKQVKNAKKIKPILNTKPSHMLKDYAGNYENPAYGTIKITSENERLYAKLGTERAMLKHKYYDVFEPQSVDKEGVADTAESAMRFNFTGGLDGKIQKLNVPLDEGKEIVFEFRPEQMKLSLKELEKYVGEYSLGTVTAKVYLKADTLFVVVPGQPDYETISTGDKEFTLKTLTGFSVKFEVIGNELASSMTFIQPNGVFKALRKK